MRGDILKETPSINCIARYNEFVKKFLQVNLCTKMESTNQW